jgi:hypothetical protein
VGDGDPIAPQRLPPDGRRSPGGGPAAPGRWRAAPSPLPRPALPRCCWPGPRAAAASKIDRPAAARRDNLRTFFELTFPNLLKKVFGYDDYDASWLNVVAKVRRWAPLGPADNAPLQAARPPPGTPKQRRRAC